MLRWNPLLLWRFNSTVQHSLKCLKVFWQTSLLLACNGVEYQDEKNQLGPFSCFPLVLSVCRYMFSHFSILCWLVWLKMDNKDIQINYPDTCQTCWQWVYKEGKLHPLSLILCRHCGTLRKQWRRWEMSICLSKYLQRFLSFSKDNQLNKCPIFPPLILNDDLDHFTLEAIEFMGKEGLEAESTDFSQWIFVQNIKDFYNKIFIL